MRIPLTDSGSSLIFGFHGLVTNDGSSRRASTTYGFGASLYVRGRVSPTVSLQPALSLTRVMVENIRGEWATGIGASAIVRLTPTAVFHISPQLTFTTDPAPAFMGASVGIVLSRAKRETFDEWGFR